MFNHLIESSSHFREYKRRGSFLLFTTAVYAVLFVVSGVVAIYAYDARLEKQSLEFVILLPPHGTRSGTTGSGGPTARSTTSHH